MGEQKKLNVSGVILRAGIALLLAGPLVALTPTFAPPPNGCPCPQGLDVTTPFGDVGILVSVIGTATLFVGALQHRREAAMATSIPRRNVENSMVAVTGLALILIAAILAQIDVSGPGWQIYLYDGQAFYLGTLGMGILLFAGLALVTRKRMNAIFLALGVVLVGVSLFASLIAQSEFSLRCSPDVGCSPILASSTVSEVTNLGYLLAAGAFLLALGLALSLAQRRTMRP